jgi:hypothetical protein
MMLAWMLAHASAMQLAAAALLMLYLAAVAILLPREIAFLREVEPATRAHFIIIDVLLQVGILTVLLPCATRPRLSLATVVVVLSGFALLWVVAIWMMFARRLYVYRLLKAARDENEQRIKDAAAKAKQAKEDTGD